MQKVSQSNIYKQYLGTRPLLRVYKGEEIIQNYEQDYVQPVDWFDIRTDCPKNSIALYVAHTEDYSSYDNLGFTSNCSGGYKVYIDGIQYGSTYTSGSTCSITWSSANITTGRPILTPTKLIAHKIWIVPANIGNNITAFHCDRVAASGSEEQGILWEHFNLTNSIDISYLNSTGSLAPSNYYNPNLVACTAKNNTLNFTEIQRAFLKCENLIYLPSLNRSTSNWLEMGFTFTNCYLLETVKFKNTIVGSGNYCFHNCYKLKEIIGLEYTSALTVQLFSYITNSPFLKDTILDLSSLNKLKGFGCFGKSSYFMSGFKGLRVSNEAPFNHTTAPQINVSYTGMDSSALRQLFYDLPYNVGYDIIGGVTIDNNDVATGFDCYPNSSAYLRVGPATTPVYGFDSKIKVITGSSIDNDPIIGRGGNNFSTPTISFRSTTRIEVSVRDTDATILYSYAGDLSTPLQLNTTYYAVTTYNGDTWTWKVLDASDNVLWTHTSTTIAPLTNMRLTLGGWQTDVSYSKFKGSIDLKNSYINIQSTTNKGLVGYEIVGSPTITNGIASGFSVNNYLKSEQHLPDKVKTLEVNVEFTLPATISASTKNTGIVSWFAQHNNDNYLDAYVHINNNNNITAYMFRDVNNNYRAYSIDGYNLATHPNETFIANFKTDLSTVECKLYNKAGTLLAEQTYTNQKLDGSLYWEFYVGVRATLMHAFTGAVNLNNTYLVLDGKVWCGQGQELVPWFTRKENMVKKIDCTGCTGNQTVFTSVGSPTITDGVASGFSASNYIKTSEFSPSNKSWEVVCDFTTGADVITNQGVLTGLGNTDSVAPMYIQQGSLSLFLSSNGSSWNIAQGLSIITPLSINTNYRIKVVYDTNDYKAYSFENNEWVLKRTVSNSTAIYGSIPLVFGNNRGNGQGFLGSINLNNTYIKVNDELWLGREQYLLPEDKAIVTNKGWAFN